MLLLFLMWSNSFVAIEYLLGGSRPRLDWLSLTVVRFVPAAVLCWAYCLLHKRAETIAVLRAHRWRLLVGGVLVVPVYNFCLGFGQQNGVPAAIASLTTALAPLFILGLAAVFLKERSTFGLAAGLAVALLGMVMVALARGTDASEDYSWAVTVTACAPLAWAFFSILSKPVAARTASTVWSSLTIAIGGLFVLPLLPGEVWRRWAALDASGWVAILYLSVLCTVFGTAIWMVLLRHLPAGVVGLSVFLNPPLTSLSKLTLAKAWPETFHFTVSGGECAGAVVVLAGVALGIGFGSRKSGPGEDRCDRYGVS